MDIECLRRINNNLDDGNILAPLGEMRVGTEVEFPSDHRHCVGVYPWIKYSNDEVTLDRPSSEGWGDRRNCADIHDTSFGNFALCGSYMIVKSADYTGRRSEIFDAKHGDGVTSTGWVELTIDLPNKDPEPIPLNFMPATSHILNICLKLVQSSVRDDVCVANTRTMQEASVEIASMDSFYTWLMANSTITIHTSDGDMEHTPQNPRATDIIDAYRKETQYD